MATPTLVPSQPYCWAMPAPTDGSVMSIRGLIFRFIEAYRTAELLSRRSITTFGRVNSTVVLRLFFFLIFPPNLVIALRTESLGANLNCTTTSCILKESLGSFFSSSAIFEATLPLSFAVATVGLQTSNAIRQAAQTLIFIIEVRSLTNLLLSTGSEPVPTYWYAVSSVSHKRPSSNFPRNRLN